MEKVKNNNSSSPKGYNRKYDLLLLLISLGFIYILIQGTFYSYTEERNYNDSKEEILKSTQFTSQQKKEIEIKSKTDIEKIKKKWGYYLTFSGVLWGTINTISNYPDLTYQEKIYYKHGLLSLSLDAIKNQSHESAVILIPIIDAQLNDPNYSISYNNQNYTLKGIEKNKKYFNWFVYPRKIVFLTHEDSEYLDKVTHVYTFNNQGLDLAAAENPKPWKIYPIRR